MAQKKDGDEKPTPPPLENRKVKVDAHPRSTGGKNPPGGPQYSRKVDKSLKGDIEKAMDAADPDVDSQVEAAKGAVEENKDKVDETLVDMVSVEVTGDVDGDQVEFDFSFFPGETDDGDKK